METKNYQVDIILNDKDEMLHVANVKPETIAAYKARGVELPKLMQLKLRYMPIATGFLDQKTDLDSWTEVIRITAANEATIAKTYGPFVAKALADKTFYKVRGVKNVPTTEIKRGNLIVAPTADYFKKNYATGEYLYDPSGKPKVGKSVKFFLDKDQDFTVAFDTACIGLDFVEANDDEPAVTTEA